MLNILRKLAAGALFPSLIFLPLVSALPSHAGDWDGPYAGVSVGGRDVSVDWKTLNIFRTIGPVSLESDPNESFDDTDFRAGGYVGYNWQVQPLWVIGV